MRRLDVDQSCEPVEPWRACQNLGQEPVIEQSLDGGGGRRRYKNAFQLRANPLGGELRQARPQFYASAEPSLIERTSAEIGVEAEEAEDTEIVLFDAGFRIADEAHTPRREIVVATKRVIERPVGPGIKRVQGEIAPRCVLCPILGKGDRRVAAEGLNVAPERRHFECNAVSDDGHRAVLNPGRDCLEAGFARARHGLVRRCCGGKVDVSDFQPEQRIAHSTADRPRLDAIAGKGREGALGLWTLEPRSIAKRWARALIGGVLLGHEISAVSRCRQA